MLTENHRSYRSAYSRRLPTKMPRLIAVVFLFLFPILTTAQVPEAITGFQFPIVETHIGFDFAERTPAIYQCGQTTTWVYHPGRDMSGALCCSNSPDSGGDRDLGMPVYAAATGRAVYANTSEWGGVVIQHLYQGQTFYSQYGHVRNTSLSPGQVVQRGQQIAEVGRQGANSAHLHLELRTASHPDPTNGSYWQSCNQASPNYLVLQNLTNVQTWYENPSTFIPTHGPYTSVPNRPPTARFLMSSGGGPPAAEGQNLNLTVSPESILNVDFSAAPSSDPDSDPIVGWYWEINGSPVSFASSFTFGLGVGNHIVTLVVTDSLGAPSVAAQGGVVITELGAPGPSPNVFDRTSGSNVYQGGLNDANWIGPMFGVNPNSGAEFLASANGNPSGTFQGLGITKELGGSIENQPYFVSFFITKYSTNLELSGVEYADFSLLRIGGLGGTMVWTSTPTPQVDAEWLEWTGIYTPTAADVGQPFVFEAIFDLDARHSVGIDGPTPVP